MRRRISAVSLPSCPFGESSLQTADYRFPTFSQEISALILWVRAERHTPLSSSTRGASEFSPARKGWVFYLANRERRRRDTSSEAIYNSRFAKHPNSSMLVQYSTTAL